MMTLIHSEPGYQNPKYKRSAQPLGFMPITFWTSWINPNLFVEIPGFPPFFWWKKKVSGFTEKNTAKREPDRRVYLYKLFWLSIGGWSQPNHEKMCAFSTKHLGHSWNNMSGDFPQKTSATGDGPVQGILRSPPGMVLKPVVNNGISTTNPNWWVSLPDFWLPSTHFH